MLLVYPSAPHLQMGSKLKNDILLNSILFNKIKTVYENKENEDLDAEDLRLIEVTYKEFVRNGANLKQDDKDKRICELENQINSMSLETLRNKINELEYKIKN